MNIDEWISRATNTLAKTSTTPRLDAEVLLCDELSKDKAWLLAHPDYGIDAKIISKLKKQISKRAKGVPLAYLRGFSEFYGRRFAVNPKVLVPRPESETMIELLKKRLNNTNNLKIADVGSGSGVLGITAALEIPGSTIDFYDVDPHTLAVAKANARDNGVAGQYYVSNLLQPNWGPYDVILANLPYVPVNYPINEGARHEPKLALFAGNDGLDLYRELFRQLSSFVWKPQFVYTESLSESHSELQKIAKNFGYVLVEQKDLIQVFVALV